MNRTSGRGSRWIGWTLTIARLIGRRIAREQFAALNAANDNRPKDAQEDGAGKE